MDLHGQIMNIETPSDIQGQLALGLGWPDRGDALGKLRGALTHAENKMLDSLLEMSFKIGHKVARHAAADLVVTQGAH